MDLATLGRYIPRIEAELRRTYATERRATARTFRPYLDLLDRFTLRGGKRFRALLVLAGYHIATARAPEAVLPAAAALEHFQSWMLVHDDVIDHSDLRRGGPTLHRELESRHRTSGGTGDAEWQGVGLAITLGDLEEPFTIASLLETRAPAARRLAALAEYVRMTRQTAYGQLLDIENGGRPVGEVTEADVLTVHRLKSAYYTVASPLRIGALLGGGRAGLLAALESFGVDIGTAFQLRDDVLGAGFDEGASGKSSNDLVEGKRTLLVVRAWAEADAAGRAALEAVLGRPSAAPQAIAAAREILRSTGSLAYSEARIRALARRAYRVVDRSPSIRSAARPLLGEIGERLVRRSS